MDYAKIAALYPLYLREVAKENHRENFHERIAQVTDNIYRNLGLIKDLLSFNFDGQSEGLLEAAACLYSENQFRCNELDKVLRLSDDYEAIKSTHVREYFEFVAWLRERYFQAVIDMQIALLVDPRARPFNWTDYMSIQPTRWPGRDYLARETDEASVKYCKEAIKLFWSSRELKRRVAVETIELQNGFYRRIGIECDFSISDKLLLRVQPIGGKELETVVVTDERFENFGYGKITTKPDIDNWTKLPCTLAKLVDRQFKASEWIFITNNVCDWFKKKTSGSLQNRPGGVRENGRDFIVGKEHLPADVFDWSDREPEDDRKTIYLTSNQDDDIINIAATTEGKVIAEIKIRVSRTGPNYTWSMYETEEITFPEDSATKYFHGLENMAAKAHFAIVFQFQVQKLLQDGSWVIPRDID